MPTLTFHQVLLNIAVHIVSPSPTSRSQKTTKDLHKAHTRTLAYAPTQKDRTKQSTCRQMKNKLKQPDIAR